ncbi:MAG: right-handed parallel beta-helix repeat-containing protein, partial [Candidatus Cloacimonetes bacterium]|nr:right-handed parallel beta-helix repeat-containing protein [Candidatus Cloacimonadota bacterium]
PTLTNNNFQNTNTNIYFSNTTSPVIGSGNSISDGLNGVRFNTCISPVISAGNTIEDHTNYGVYYQTCSSLGTIDSITLNNNDGYGAFKFENCGDFNLGSSNIFSGNSWPLTIDAGCFPDPGSTIPTSGNTNNDIRVTSGSGTNTGTWYPFTGLDYIVTETPTLGVAGSLTLAVNMLLKFNAGISFSIYGTMNAQGGEGNAITFTGNGAVEWSGLHFQSNSIGYLEFCTIENVSYGSGYGVYANSSNSLTVNYCHLLNNDFGFYGNNATPTLTNNNFQNTNTNIYFSNTTAPVIGSGNSISSGSNGVRFNTCISPVISAGNTIEDNTNCGVYYQTCSSLGTIDSMTLDNNEGYGAFRFENCGDFTLGHSNYLSNNSWPLTIDTGSFPAPSSYIPSSGNTNNDIRATSGAGTNTGTWYPFAGLDYIITESPTLGAAGVLTIADGAELKFLFAKSFEIYGTLLAPGSTGIKFTRKDSVEWSGLKFYTGSTGDLEYCTIEYATYSNSYGIYAIAPTSLSLDNCVLQNNDFGFYGNNCDPDFSANNEFINNNNYGIYLTGNCTPTFGSNLTEWNDIYGNGTNDLRNGDNDIFAKYVYWGTILSTEIQAQIYDQNDDGALGLVDYIPYTDAAHHLEYAGDVTIPQNVSINITGDFVEISWDAVEGASSYKIYSSADPYAAIPWSFEYEVTVTNWSEPVDSKKFYYVTAVN